MLNALTRDVGPEITKCEITHISRESIDVIKAVEQHVKYKEKLADAGAKILALPALDGQPDAVFVEDTAIVLPEIAIMTTMGAKSRENEVESIAEGLASFRKLIRLQSPAKIEGGDVMRIDKTLYVGLSTRTNQEAVQQLSRAIEPYGYRVVPLNVTGCLHLKTGCTYIGQNKLLVNRSWVDVSDLSYDIVDVHADEPLAANSLLINDVLLYSASFPLTRRLLEKNGLRVEPVDISELEKAEAGLTCMSIIFDV
jgi:dimethylargininase